jgi:hypothetical protein
MFAEFIPKNLEKAVDLARHIATFAELEFTACHVRMRMTDPAKVVYMDLILLPSTYRCDKESRFGINLQMFYKLLKSLDNDDTVEIEADESVMKINQGSRYHTLISQDIPFATAAIADYTGYRIKLPTKMLQRYIRAIGNIAPAFELHYVPKSDTLFLESVNSMYRTLFSIDTGVTPNEGAGEYKQNFMVKFFEMALNPSLAETVELTMGESLMICYDVDTVSVLITVSGYTDA